MRILHTSDWHLGKTLEYASRIDEQKAFLEELLAICDEERVDLVLVAGDIYDTQNPSAAAEKLFYHYLLKLAKKGERPVVIISGNHDSPDRLTAPNPFMEELGVILMGPAGLAPALCANGFYSIVNSGDGFFEIRIGNETAVIICMPFPSEKRLNEIMASSPDEALYQKEYSEKIGLILKDLAKNFRSDTINITTGHFYINGGEESGSERSIQLGGSMSVSPACLPPQAQYTAMGHLHRPQKISGGPKNAYYAGSPIQYSKSEIGYAKSVYIADIVPGVPAQVHKRYLRNYKPIEVWQADSVADALALCEEKSGHHSWVFLEIKTDKVIAPSEIKAMKSLKKDILEIMPIMASTDPALPDLPEEKSFFEDFTDFYRHLRGIEPPEDIKDLFQALCMKDEMIQS